MNQTYEFIFLKHTLMLNPALALVSINMTPRSFALPSPSSIETCLFHEMQQKFSNDKKNQGRERPPSRYYIKKTETWSRPRKSPNPGPLSLAGRHCPLNGPARGWRAGRNQERARHKERIFLTKPEIRPSRGSNPGPEGATRKP
jgi:hypothetical protein